MAGIGPPPKDPALRQRRNKAPSAGTLPPPSKRRRVRVPPPAAREGGWHPRALAFWSALWRSSQAAELTQPIDHEVMLTLVDVVHDLQYAADFRERTAMLVQLRLLLVEYGFTKMALRRLQWTVEPEEPRRPRASASGQDREDVVDPRSVLRAVK